MWCIPFIRNYGHLITLGEPRFDAALYKTYFYGMPHIVSLDSVDGIMYERKYTVMKTPRTISYLREARNGR